MNMSQVLPNDPSKSPRIPPYEHVFTCSPPKLKFIVIPVDEKTKQKQKTNRIHFDGNVPWVTE